MYDTNQLHAAVVELVALDNAEIKYPRCRTYAGDENGKGGIYNFVTSEGYARESTPRFLDAGGNWFRYYLEVPQLCISGG